MMETEKKQVLLLKKDYIKQLEQIKINQQLNAGIQLLLNISEEQNLTRIEFQTVDVVTKKIFYKTEQVISDMSQEQLISFLNVVLEHDFTIIVAPFEGKTKIIGEFSTIIFDKMIHNYQNFLCHANNHATIKQRTISMLSQQNGQPVDNWYWLSEEFLKCERFNSACFRAMYQLNSLAEIRKYQLNTDIFLEENALNHVNNCNNVPVSYKTCFEKGEYGNISYDAFGTISEIEIECDLGIFGMVTYIIDCDTLSNEKNAFKCLN